jgi:hypothetical protein
VAGAAQLGSMPLRLHNRCRRCGNFATKTVSWRLACLAAAAQEQSLRGVSKRWRLDVAQPSFADLDRLTRPATAATWCIAMALCRAIHGAPLDAPAR